MTIFKFDPAFFVKHGRKISPNGNSDTFVYENKDALLIIDGEMDFTGNDITITSERIVVTPRGTLLANNINLTANHILIHGKVHGDGDIDVNASTLDCIRGTRWFSLRKQLTSYTDQDNTPQERINIANGSL